MGAQERLRRCVEMAEGTRVSMQESISTFQCMHALAEKLKPMKPLLPESTTLTRPLAS